MGDQSGLESLTTHNLAWISCHCMGIFVWIYYENLSAKLPNLDPHFEEIQSAVQNLRNISTPSSLHSLAVWNFSVYFLSSNNMHQSTLKRYLLH